MIHGLDRATVTHDEKPCARRVGKRLWCHLPADHLDPESKHYTPDCEGLGVQEFPVTDYGPKWWPGWSKK